MTGETPGKFGRIEGMELLWLAFWGAVASVAVWYTVEWKDGKPDFNRTAILLMVVAMVFMFVSTSPPVR